MNIIKRAKEIINKNILIFIKGGKISFSQEGEDVLLRNMLGDVKNGFFVDVGAYHPYIFSNTFIFYNNGWQGINIDPNPATIELFDKYRPKDINIETAVGSKCDRLTYYMFKDGAINTIDKKISNNNIRLGYKLIEKRNVNVDTLKKILTKYNPNKIDLMSIDVEGHELDVIKHNDWKKFRPKVLLIEIFNDVTTKEIKKEDMWISPEQLIDNPINKYLCKKGYRFVAKSISSAIYVDKKTAKK